MDDAYTEDVLNLPEGKVSLRCPAMLSPESVEDLGDFMELILLAKLRNTRRVEVVACRLTPQLNGPTILCHFGGAARTTGPDALTVTPRP